MQLDLSNTQIKALSEVTMGMGHAIFVSIIVPIAFNVDTITPEVLLLGWFGCGLCWTFSIQILK